tara:strand:+ start:2096 stop:2704 length:609 start_codon:yes stop_codon:yes gene_type:complete
MKKFEIETSPKRQTFIEGWLAEDNELCDNLIELFESNESKHIIGESYTGLNKETKDSIDMVINPIDIENIDYKPVSNYMTHLNKCYWEYLKKYNMDNHLKDLHIGPFNIQKYNKGGHFKSWHSERMNMESSSRLFAWMTYLNTVNDGGETEFYYFDIKVKPIKGLTIIWPSEWTHLHKGSITNEIKYVITGWIHFPDNLKGV